MKPSIIGTAGHIDHGKTALVKALTGTDTDRLKEERERGITIELGYAFLSDRIAIIDVPGHERFIKNMVAGASTVDFALLVVAADDGVMPQTREHFDILRLLGVAGGAIAITKCGLADEEWIDLVEDDVRRMVSGSFLEGAPIVRVDSLDGRGVEDVRAALLSLAGRDADRAAGDLFRLPIDRAFTIKGFGTVVTGSALSGAVSVDDRLELLPRGDVVRVRGIETQGRRVETVSAGMRAALNVPGLAVEEIARGDVLATPGRLRPTFMLDVECRILESSPIPLEQRQRVRVHVGTKEVMARAVVLEADRIEPGEEGLVQLRLEERTSAQRLDRYVVRRYSPQITIGGGRVLDANPEKHRRRHIEEVVGSLRGLGETREDALVAKVVRSARAISFDDLVTRTNLPGEVVEEAIGVLGVAGDVIEIEAKGRRHLAPKEAYDEVLAGLSKALGKYHSANPLRAGAKRGEILARWKKDLPDFLLRHFVEMGIAEGRVASAGGDLLSLPGFEVRLGEDQRRALDGMERDLLEGRFQPPDAVALAAARGLDDKAARQLLQVLVDRGRVVNLDGKLYFHVDVVREGARILEEGFEPRGEMTMSEIRVLLDTTRKYALPLMSHYDGLGITRRRGDVRVPGANLGRAEI